jgi:hypothetical protein
MEFIRFGGANKKHQKNKRAPAGRGIWCFPLGLIDKFYLTGTDKLYQSKDGKWKLAKSCIFKYRGEIWVGTDDIPARFLHKALKIVNRGEKEWALLDYHTFKKVYNLKKRLHLKSPEALWGGNEKVPFNAAFECFIE